MFGSPDYKYAYPWSGQGYPYGTATGASGQYATPQPQQQQSANNISVVLIHGGDAAADAYLMAPNQTVVLVDNESGKVYIKETNGSGMQITNRKFKEEKQASLQQMQADFVTREEFEKRIAELANVSKSIPTA